MSSQKKTRNVLIFDIINKKKFKFNFLQNKENNQNSKEMSTLDSWLTEKRDFKKAKILLLHKPNPRLREFKNFQTLVSS